MQFKFDANQGFQIDAVEAVATLFTGQPPITHELDLALPSSFSAVSNRLDLDDPTLLENLKATQEQSQLPLDDDLAPRLQGTIETDNGTRPHSFLNFSVEMETGTGKTYVYIRTALELYKRYGYRKFVIVVPSVAIREGVLKTLEITKPHFQQLYDKTPYRYYVYDSANLSQVRQFAAADSVELMIMTLDSFNKAANVIHQSTDRLHGDTPIQLIQATRPILILDEPQNMESEKSIAALAGLAPLFALRYSATHRNPYSLVYRLTPYDAYRQGLVKHIEVAALVEEDDHNRVFLRLDDLKTSGTNITAKVAAHAMYADGGVKEKVFTLKPGDSLREKTGRPEYETFDVQEISILRKHVKFENGLELRLGSPQGAKDALFETQIRYTIREHFDKHRQLHTQGIKTLSLFFIDRVANYAPQDGLIRRLFEKSFNDIKRDYPEWADVDPKTVHAGYFARGSGSDRAWEDSTSGAAKKDEEAYDLIMRDKERLLSLQEPVAFIFSHSALREGWDNPNVFQICTLNQSISQLRKRQEIGRGVRLAVNQAGDRVRDETVNILTVVANESYRDYVAKLQKEVQEEFGSPNAAPTPSNARKRKSTHLRKGYELLPEFQELWNHIRQKTRYAVRIDTQQLVADVVKDLDEEHIPAPRITAQRAEVWATEDDQFRAFEQTGAVQVFDLAGRQPLPNIVDLMTHLLEYTTPRVLLTRRTLGVIFKGISDKNAALANPQQFATIAVRCIKTRLADQLVDGIQYKKIDEWYEMARFETDIDSWENYLVPATRALYDYVICDSDVERNFVADLENRTDVRLYIKLPGWFTVPTPVGEYNPDWAIVMEDRDEHKHTNGRPLLYLVRETKSSTERDKLRPDERRKLVCGQRHFVDALGTSYKVITSASELP